MSIANDVIIIAEENPQYDKSPKTLGGNSINLCVNVPNVDEIMKKAADGGVKVLIPAADQFYGDRSGRVEDPFGHVWIISTHIKDVSAEDNEESDGRVGDSATHGVT